MTEPVDVPTYSQDGIIPITMDNGKDYSRAHGYFMTKSGYPIDNAATRNQYGIRNDSVFVRGFDLWTADG
jgi:NADPH-dependent 7-cyano-7-deazaguanine reductase QueF-like protein